MSLHGQLTPNNLPAAFVNRMQKQLSDAPLFFEALQSVPPVSIRLNPAKLPLPDSPFLTERILSKVEWCRHAYYLDRRPVFTLDPCLHSGGYYVQEASSMFLDQILQQILPPHPLRVLDLCAAPGGKSTLLASALPAGSLLVANEVIRTRAAILKENLIKWGADNVVITQNDPAYFSYLRNCFDLILVDAPCSGEGMFRKDEKAISEWSERNLQLCKERQQRILKDIWPTLKPGGYLLYSTCTYNPGENEEILSWLLSQYDALSVSVTHTLGDSLSPTLHGYQFYPHKIKGEGFFIGVIQKTGEQKETPQVKKEKKSPVRLPEGLQELLPQDQEFSGYNSGNVLGIIPTRHAEFTALLDKQLTVLYKGCELAEINGRKFKMQPALALYQCLDKTRLICKDTDLESALRYLKKEDISTDAPAGSWVLITHNGMGMGWGKSLGSRLNNYYPKEWRIRMSTD